MTPAEELKFHAYKHFGDAFDKVFRGDREGALLALSKAVEKLDDLIEERIKNEREETARTGRTAGK